MFCHIFSPFPICQCPSLDEGIFSILLCLHVQKQCIVRSCSSERGQKSGRVRWVFTNVVCVCACVHVCVRACVRVDVHVCVPVYTHVGVSDIGTVVGLLEADSLSVGSRNIFTSNDPLDLVLQVSFAFFLLFASLPHQTYHIPFSSAKKKKKKPSLGFPSDFSLSLDEVPAIYIFVCSEGGGNRINKAPANPAAPLDWKGLPGLMAAGLPNW